MGSVVITPTWYNCSIDCARDASTSGHMAKTYEGGSDVSSVSHPPICGIYKITNIVNGKYYVGSSANIAKRVAAHLRCKGSIALSRAIAKYGVNNFVYEVLETCPKHDLIQREQFYINSLKPKYNLSYTAGKIDQTPSVRAKISKALKAYFRDNPAAGDKISAAQKGRTPHNKGKSPSQETLIKLHISHLGKMVSEETRAKMRAAAAGKRPSDLCIERGRTASIGRIVSAETRAKSSAAHKGKPSPRRGAILSDETRAKISSTQIGRKASDETRAKMSAKRRGENSNTSKLTWEQVDEIRSRYSPRKVSQRQLANEFGVDQQVIWAIVNRKTWRDK